MTIKTIPSVISIDSRDTYEEAIMAHLDALTEEEKSRRVNDSLIIADVVNVGPTFTLLAGGDNVANIIGLLELIKIYILTSEVDYE